jgi:hypothetical protein
LGLHNGVVKGHPHRGTTRDVLQRFAAQTTLQGEVRAHGLGKGLPKFAGASAGKDMQCERWHVLPVYCANDTYVKKNIVVQRD